MKKILLIISLLLLSATLQAQYGSYYYHRVGDTIEWKSEIGYYSWWEWQYFYEHQLPMNVSRTGLIWGFDAVMYEAYSDSLIFLQRYYTPVPLKIVGIAGVTFRGYPIINVGWIPVEDSIQEYFLVYDAIGDSFPLVAQLPWHALDTMRTLHIMNRPFELTLTTIDCCSPHSQSQYLPLKEYYLDSAVYVSDSFYVGGTIFGQLRQYTDVVRTCIYAGYSNLNNCMTLAPCNEVQDSFCRPLGISYKLKGYSGPDDMRYPPCQNQTAVNPPLPFCITPWRWMHAPQPAALMIYPIIEVDTTVPPVSACDPIANVQATVSGTSATVTWDGFPNYSSILLRYGKAHLPQSQWSEIDVTGNTLYTLTGLEPMSRYSVTLKAECDTSKKETPWSTPVTFYVADTSSGGGTNGVEAPTLLSQLTFLQPNPAQDEVTVTSSFNLIAIDIWTADGVMVYHGDKSGHDAVLDVSYLRAGTYIVAIHTHNGTTHKKLQIVR